MLCYTISLINYLIDIITGIKLIAITRVYVLEPIIIVQRAGRRGKGWRGDGGGGAEWCWG